MEGVLGQFWVNRKTLLMTGTTIAMLSNKDSVDPSHGTFFSLPRIAGPRL